ncbi:MAG TPA: secretin N-terminal domain-containing protein [Blastocatellia bacterium]|nr:secretin N-terminal domain-containing protein [Blastocatellia bacterium]
MKRLRFVSIVALIAFLGLPGILFGKAQDNKKPEPQIDVSVLKQLKGKVFELKYRQPSDIFNIIRPLGSGYAASMIQPSDESHTITVRDFPENIAAIEEAIARLDTPQNRKPDVNLEVRLSLVEASRSASIGGGDVPPAIAPVLDELRKTLQFKSYRYITTFVNRTRENANVSGSGFVDSLFSVPETKGRANSYDYVFSVIRLLNGDGPDPTIDVRDFRFGAVVPVITNNSPGHLLVEDKRIGIETPLSLKDGETLVVGNANAGSSDETLFVVVSIKKVK